MPGLVETDWPAKQPIVRPRVAPIPVKLPSIEFPTKTKAKEFFKKMLSKYDDHEVISPEDHLYLDELILLHSEADDKIGMGIKRFFKAPSPEHPTSCFHLERLDGVETDFSYIDCISNTKPTLAQYFYRACRQSVYECLIQQKNELFENGPVFCCKTNEPVTRESSEYRHTEPRFIELIREFITTENIIIKKEMFVDDDDLQYTTRFIDKLLESKFIEFHQQKANLNIFKKDLRY
jgi:hypothetical protein